MPVKKRHTISEPDLVSLLKSKDTRGMSILYDNYATALYGIIQRVIENKELASDVLQDVFVKIWKNIDQFDAEKGRLFTWMLNIARNSSIDTVRSKSFGNENKNRSIDGLVRTVDSQLSSSTNPETIGVKQLVEKLEPEQRKIIDLLYFGGLTQQEVAEKLQIPLGTVKTRARAAIMVLRKKFD